MHYMSDRPTVSENDIPLFAMSNISYTYPDTTQALDSIFLSIYQGDRIALVGRNGSGKSTLIRHLNGLIPTQNGLLTYQGEELSPDTLNQLRLKVGILFQDPDNHLFCNTLYEDVAFGPMNQGRPRDEVDLLVKRNLSAVGLDHLMYKPAHLLSYGQKKRAAFAAILAMEPEVLILDEPTANLDPRQEKVFKKLLSEFKGTLIIIEHDLLFLYDICDRAVVLADGHIHHDYSFQELVSHQQALYEHGLDFTFRFTCCGRHHPASGHHHHHHSHDHSHGNNNDQNHVPTATSEAPLLELQHYNFIYGDNTKGITDINIIIHPGETIALIGENGAGKSTLASCLLGLNRGDGYYFLKGEQLKGSQLRKLWHHVGMVFQNSADQLFCPSCWEEVAFGPQQMKLSTGEVEERVAEALRLVRLTGYEQRVPLNMSGGERKRLAIAAALAMQPEMLILDEPTASLDPRSEELLLEILESLSMTRILITHDLFFIERLSSRTIVMHQGEIVRDYRTTDFLADDHLQAVNGLDYTYKNNCFREIMELQQQNGSSADHHHNQA